jgi:hypothetical protein
MSIRVASVNGRPPEQTPFQITMIPNWEDNTYLLVENGVVKGFYSGVDASRYRNLSIPATIWGEQVTAIGNDAFREKQLESVVIPDNVTTIGDNAFASNSLRDIVIGKGVTSIMDNAFAFNSYWSRSISIPGNVTFVTVSTEEERAPRMGMNSQGNVTIATLFDMGNFMQFYDRRGKKAGKYTYAGGIILTWKYSPE